MHRRTFIKAAGVSALTALLPLRVAHASDEPRKKLLVVVLRGALDGLAAVVPYRDPAYRKARAGLALPESEQAMLDLDGEFALHAAMAPLHTLYQKSELLFMHAVATPYRKRSHFDAQDLLESGGERPHALRSGWLNRTLSAINEGAGALAIGATVPQLLQGDASVNSWAPSALPGVDEAFLNQVATMYAQDAVLGNALGAARQLDSDDMARGRGMRDPRAFAKLMQQAARFLRATDGPQLATIDINGWDTHANQGLASGQLANNLKRLAAGLVDLRRAMGNQWQHTAVLVVTEFGRTVRPNGTRGTDHGTASVAMLLGGNIAGGRVIGDWPSLATLYQDRDLYPANDLRTLLKGTLHEHLQIPRTTLDEVIFPGSAGVAMPPRLLRS